MNANSRSVFPSFRSSRFVRACAPAGFVLTTAALGLGCVAPTDGNGPSTAENATSSTAEALTLKDLMGDFGTASTIASATNTILEWYGVNLFGSTGPTTQDVLNEVNKLSAQIDQVDAKVDVLLQDAQTLQVSLQTISNQQVELNVDAQLALMHGNVVNLATYAYELSQGASPDSGNVATLSGSTAASVYYFEQPALYQQLNSAGGTSWTPIFAVAPFIKAATIRTVVLGSLFPTTYRNIPGVVDELKNTAAFASSLATKTDAWGRASCTVTTKYKCTSGHYEVEIVNTKPVKFFECDVENDSYTATCPGATYTKSGFNGVGEAAYAGNQKLPSLYPTMDTFLGVDGLRQLARDLTTISGSGSTLVHPIEGVPAAGLQ
jgi:hypothetical protein